METAEKVVQLLGRVERTRVLWSRLGTAPPYSELMQAPPKFWTPSLKEPVGVAQVERMQTVELEVWQTEAVVVETEVVVTVAVDTDQLEP